MAAPFDRIEEEADEDIAGDLGEDPPPRASAPPLSEGVRHAAAEPMPRAIAAAAEVPSERFLGESRREQLKRKAAPLSRSLLRGVFVCHIQDNVYQRYQGCHLDIRQCEFTGSG